MNSKILEGWMSIAEAAEVLGISRQGVHSRLQRDAFKEVRTVPMGKSARPLYLVNVAEVEAMAGKKVSRDDVA